MTVRLKIAGGEQAEDLRKGTLYKIQSNGVLTIVLQKDKLDYCVLREFSPAGWDSVSGHRFLAETKNLEPTEDGDDFLFEQYDVRESFF
jgi:hypothetical protein